MLDVDVEIPRREFAVRVALRVGPGERLALHGPSGAGKSSVLEAVAGLAPVRRGEIRLDGRVLTRTQAPAVAVPVAARRVGLLRQRARLFPHLTVDENLRYPRRGPDGRLGGADPAWLAELVDRLELAPLLGARPAALSGGQLQRAALARVLATDHQALLLDEPLTGQDPALRHDLRWALAALLQRRPVPAVLVTHDLDEAQGFGERVAVVDRGELLQVDRPDALVRRPASPRVAALVGYAGLVPAAHLLRGGRPGVGGWVAVHPDRAVAGDHPHLGPALVVQVVGLVPSGPGWTVWGELGAGGRLRLRLADPAPVGGRLTVTLVDPPWFDSPAPAAAAPAAAGPVPAGAARAGG